MSAASAQAASRLAERLAMRSRSARQAEAQTADLVQVHLATIHVFLYRMSLTLCTHSRTCGNTSIPSIYTGLLVLCRVASRAMQCQPHQEMLCTILAALV